MVKGLWMNPQTNIKSKTLKHSVTSTMLFQPTEINHTPKIVPNKCHPIVKDQLFQDRKVITDGLFHVFEIKGRKMFTFDEEN
jgi:hypothetical protein